MNTPSPTLIALHQLSLYNSGRMSSEQIITTFAARRPLLDRILIDLSAEKPRSRAQHHLIVGQRGMGKTMLLARVAAELRTNDHYKGRFIPLVFAEEQYAVDRLSKFWLNCLDSLADAREAAKDKAAVDTIDAQVAHLTSRAAQATKYDQPFADEVYAAFSQAAQTNGQRPVLLVDNLQLVFERLETAQQHSLRELLTRPAAPIVVGASPSPPPSTQDYGAAFYDHFKVHYLRPLEEGEMRELLLHLAEAAQREDVRQRVLQHPARLKVLRQLTGGNPRTTLTLFFLYAEDFAPTVFGDLEGLLDRVTPLYKARFEELTNQQQVIVSSVANHWDPVTASTLAASTLLPASTISAQLDRLEKTGTLERVELFNQASTGYQIAERFFNIWFLMRSASRRQRREVEFLTRFLESFYEPLERSRLARHLMTEDRLSADRYLWSRAVADSLTEPETAEELKRHTDLLALQEKADAARSRLRELIDFDRLPPATLAFDELRQKLKGIAPEGACVRPEEFATAILGDRTLFGTGDREKLAIRSEYLAPEVAQGVLDTIAASRRADVETYTAEAVAWFSQRIASGQLRHRDNVEDWNRAFARADSSSTFQLMVDTLPNGFGEKLCDSAIQRIRGELEPPDGSPACRWHDWATDLHYKLAQDGDAEAAYRKAARLDPKLSNPWINLGNLLQRDPNRMLEAERAYREAIARKPSSAPAWHNLGNLLVRIHRFGEAEIAYNKAITHATDQAPSWYSLGCLLAHHLHRFTDAESAFRNAIIHNPKLSRAWSDLGTLLQLHFNRFAEAESAYREAIAHDVHSPWPWNGLAVLLQSQIHRASEAEAAYREAIVRDQSLAAPWNGLGNLLQDNPDRSAEAESAYREAIARDPNYAAPWNGLGNLYCDLLNRYDEATAAYNRAIQIDPDGELPLQNLLFLRRDFLGEGSQAKALLNDLLARPTLQCPDTLHLHEALFAAYEANWGLASDALVQAIQLRPTGFASVTKDDWLRASAVLLHLNFGAELLALLDQLGESAARLRPWVEALRALQLGDRRALQNVAPEIRVTAEIFYDGIEQRLLKLPQKTRRRPHPAPRPKQRRKK